MDMRLSILMPVDTHMSTVSVCLFTKMAEEESNSVNNGEIQQAAILLLHRHSD